MNRYYQAALQVYDQTQTALQALYSALNQGQQNKLIKNEAVAALLAHYGIVEGSGSP